MHATLNRQVPSHHQHAVGQILRTPHLNGPRDLAEQLLDKATVTAWALRPDGLAAITLSQYADLVLFDCYPLALKHALLHRGDRRHIRTVADEITRRINRRFA
ncbi:hypothetical protein ABT095_25695 [Kitasatospora sp. NPDC002227]|uniref:hypothetical protein n=1 Tax=Kitasatospora sp. NPDC002227 TaxID=3154773 RepID=UPI003316DFEF